MIKINAVKKMNLIELLNWAFENDVHCKSYITSDEDGNVSEVTFDVCGIPRFSSMVRKEDIFTVEVEEELTENTVLPSVVVVRTQYFPNNGHSVNVAKINSKSIKQVIENQPNNSKFEYHSIYLMESERIGQLIWKDGELVGDE